MKDLFMDMQAKIGCPYLSDLLYYKRAVFSWLSMQALCCLEYLLVKMSIYNLQYQLLIKYTILFVLF